MLVAVVGLGQTARSQIDSRFTALAATQVRAQPALGDQPDVIPDGADARSRRVIGVESAGLLWSVGSDPPPEVASSSVQGLGIASRTVPVFAATPGIFDAAGATGIEGRVFSAWHAQTRSQVAVLSRSAANLLDIAHTSGQPAVFINGVPFLILGIVDGFPRESRLELGVVVPAQTARVLFGPPDATSAETLIVRTRTGAAEVVAGQLAVAIRPDNPNLIAVVPPISPHRLASQVGSDLRTTFVGLGVLALVIGALGIANSTTVAVLERRGEIGLRMALGARPRHVAQQFVLEALMIGLLGGAFAAGFGSLIVVVVSSGRKWTPVLDVRVLVIAPVLGALVGACAGIVPAVRAALVDPATALRSGV
jgi:putative ABC transport system permease protein